jgi:iron complex outermembrane receptor protein
MGYRHRAGLQLRVGLRSSVAVLALMVGGEAFAQSAPDASPPLTKTLSNGAPVPEITVTGTMFRRTDTETPSPITTLTAEDLHDKGIITISDAIRSVSADNSGTLPTAFGDGFAAGASGVSLRGLTVNSTLVLIDGQRTANYALADDGERSFVDLNSIPFAVLDHVDVLKDGASSIYGADAIGGVVNVILKPTFEGVEGTVEGGDSQLGGGFQSHLILTAGTGSLSEDRYNVYFSVEAENDQRILVGQRGYPFNTQNLTPSGGLNLIGGQPEQEVGSIYGTVAPATLTNGNILEGNQIPGSLYQPLRPCGPGSTRTVNPGSGVYCAQDLQLYGDDQPKEQRFNGYARFTTKVGDDAEAYFSANYSQNKVLVDQAPGQIENGIPLNTDSIALPARLPNGALNPNDPFAAKGQAALINYAFGDIPSSLLEFNHVFRGVLGIKGTAWGWDYDAAAVVATTWLDSTDSGLIDGKQLLNDVTNGTYNFINPAANSPAVRAALAPVAQKTSTTDLDSLQFQATHPLWDLPGGPMEFGFGAGARYEATNDPNINPGDRYEGLGLAQTAGYRTATNVFIEFDAPVLDQLDLNLSGRWDHYSDFGDAFSPKAGAKWTPLEGLAFRATASQGFRAPSFAESGSSVSEGFTTYTPPQSFQNAHLDPKTGQVDGYAQQYSLGYETLANPHLQPEKSNSFTVGTIVEPIPGYSISIDYYNIKKMHDIELEDPFAALNNYYAGTALPPGYTIVTDVPDPLHPKALARPIIVGAPYVNASYLRTDGIDFDLRAKFDLPQDVKLTSTLSFTDILNYAQTQPDGTTQSYVGYQSPYELSSGAGTPQYRGSWENSVDWGALNVTGTLNYVSGIKEIASDITGDTSCFETNAVGTPYPYGCRVKAFQDFDLTASYQVTEQLQVYGAILNLFNQPPPFDPLDYAGVNYNPTFAQSGIIGRFFRIGATYRFGGPPPKMPAPVTPPASPPPLPPAPPPAAKPEVARDFQVFFDFDKSDITDAAAKVIQAAADVVKAGGIAHVTVTGHTDTVGSNAYNQALSARRAAAVQTKLVADGVPAGEIATVAAGKTGLLVPTADGVREAQNRRAVIRLD